ncbi:ABC transporter permease [Ruminiclostridium cellulolyticum]|uniref:ABC3 transporter permease C-terminal domain-containing protein n=1 Tax=Ruminiclostridium cellulolyticum (strain ATCC 35319 / DSM 5812 / JCM 6584 / H10) TaxID=394503 RepID=B8I8J5_RUMCH|nr:FtsX-like permease family protein [Ruminiclostridium cellulolyticum]ACL75228.1 protein of unknown function DUF214 [Ruminiclostridium cellulolyticum H10]
MRFLSVSWKNIHVSWRRSLTLGSFIFIATFILLFANSFIATMESNMQGALVNALTGDVQVRSANTDEEDMFSFKGSWGKISYLNQQEVSNVKTVLDSKLKPEDYGLHIRHNVFLQSEKEKLGSMIIGIDNKLQSYKDPVKLVKGKYISNTGSEIILAKDQADKLKVNVGDKLDAFAKTKDGQPTKITFTVVGISNIEILSGFSYYPAYTDLKSAQELLGLKDGEATDIIMYAKNRDNAKSMKNELKDTLDKTDIGSEKYKLSTWEKMGGYLMSTINIYIVIFYVFIAILMFIIIILIVNLVFMMGLERRQDIGTLRAVGYSKSKIVALFVTEILTITGIAFAIGAALAISLILVFSNVGLTVPSPWDLTIGKQLFLKFNIGQVLGIFGMLLGISFLSSYYPAYRSACLRPSEALREI